MFKELTNRTRTAAYPTSNFICDIGSKLPRVRILLLIFFSISVNVCLGQTRGQASYGFLNLPASARLAALGTENVSLTNRDLQAFNNNPALISDSLVGVAAASHQFMVADIGYSNIAYAHNFKKIGYMSFGVQHLAYGTIKNYDQTGASLGDYKASETALVISKSHRVANFTLGANLKAAFSNLSSYRSTAVLIDVGGVFTHPSQALTVGLVVKNAGVVLSEYSSTSDTSLPFDVQAGATFKPEYMPIRFSITAYRLAHLGDAATITGSSEPGKLDKVIRHFNFGIELLLHRNVNLMVGYNFLKHQELKLDNGGGGAGISFGFSARVKALEFVFSRSGLVAGRAAYGVTISTNIDKILTRI